MERKRPFSHVVVEPPHAASSGIDAEFLLPEESCSASYGRS